MNRLPYMAGYDLLIEMNLSKNQYRKVLADREECVDPYEEESLDTLILRTADERVHKKDRERFLAFWDLKTLMHRMCEANGVLHEEFCEKNPNGGWDQVRIVLAPEKGSHEEEDVFLSMYTILRKSELSAVARAEDAFVYHELTGLPYGNKFREEVRNYVRRQQGDCCMLVTDIEYFRFFNKWYGRESGDRILKQIGSYLREFDNTYHSYSGYCGGDNFCTVFCYKPEIAEKLYTDLCAMIGNFEGTNGFRPVIGGYMITDPECSYCDMYDYATTAMSRRADYMKNGILWYGDDMVLELENELRLLPEIQRGIREHEFTFYLQMKYSLSGQHVIGAEALLRWNHKTKGLIMPGQFIPQCEKSGMITTLDKYLWEEVCRTIRGWLDQGYDPLPVSVNVSRRDFYEIDVPEYFSNLTRKYGIATRYLEIEITESAFIEDAAVLQKAERKFHELGFTVSIDDFGSGYSSLNMLKDIQADVLKLDMKFLDLNETNLNKGKEIVRSIFSMANTLHYTVIAEGVETEAQLNTLQSIGCEYVQGYYFYHPMPVDEYERLLPQGA